MDHQLLMRIFMGLIFILVYLLRLSQAPQYQILENQTITVIGRVSQQPYLKGSQQIIEVGPVTIKTTRFPGYFYDDCLKITGSFVKKVTGQFLTRYDSYYPDIQTSRNCSSGALLANVQRFFLQTRGQIERQLSRLLPEPENSLLLGVVFGSQQNMSGDFWNKLKQTGTLHLVVASGQNVTMVSWFIMAIFALVLARPKALFFAAIAVIAYVLLVGAEPPAVRAGIMALFIFFGQLLGREITPWRSLLIAGAAILLVYPLILFDVGFQLSFAATGGIISFYPLLRAKIGKFITRRNMIMKMMMESFLTTISAQIATLPVLLANFGTFSLLAPLSNTLVLPTIPFIMSLGGMVAGVSFLSETLAKYISYFSWPFLWWFTKVVEGFSRHPGTLLETGRLGFWWAAGYYFAVILAVLLFNKRK